MVMDENEHDKQNMFDNNFLDIENIDHKDEQNHFDKNNKNLKLI
jgi:hypothetical protein